MREKFESFGELTAFRLYNKDDAEDGENRTICYIAYQTAQEGITALESVGDEFEIAGGMGKAHK